MKGSFVNETNDEQTNSSSWYNIPADNDPTPEWANTEQAETEDKNWSKLEKIRNKNDENWLTIYGYIVCGVTIVLVVLSIATLLIWAWHYVGHRDYTWLDAEQLTKIQSVLFSGGLGAVVSNAFIRQLAKVG